MSQTNNWERLKVISNIASIILIPLVIAFLGNLYSKSIKEREIQGKFVELSLEILREQPSDDNKNVRKWATEIINEYSGVKLEAEATKDLIQKIPITSTSNNKLMDIAIPVSNTTDPIELEVKFGNANLGASIIKVLDPDNKLISRFEMKSTADSRFTLPKMDLEKISYFNVIINGTSVNINQEIQRGSVTILFKQKEKVLANNTLTYDFEETGSISHFLVNARIFLTK